MIKKKAATQDSSNPYGAFAPPPPPPAGGDLARERAARPAPPPPGPAAQQLQKVANAGGVQSGTAPGGTGVATPRRREKKDKPGEMDIVKRLQAICTDADPTKLYRSLVKIGQG